MRIAVATKTPTRMTRGRRSGGEARGGEPDDHRIVAGQHQIDHDDLEKGGDRSL